MGVFFDAQLTAVTMDTGTLVDAHVQSRRSLSIRLSGHLVVRPASENQGEYFAGEKPTL